MIDTVDHCEERLLCKNTSPPTENIKRGVDAILQKLRREQMATLGKCNAGVNCKSYTSPVTRVTFSLERSEHALRRPASQGHHALYIHVFLPVTEHGCHAFFLMCQRTRPLLLVAFRYFLIPGQ